ncbi:Flp1 family type IVb pilin [Oceanobacillus kapialis]|uniref:Flp1 family type IVb pilin n=1 Tax=Oceanobacillus kapialis TaxID=481353 RepID=A0ABW5Q5I4_9BACI
MQKFKNACKRFWKDENGLQTLEIMLIIAVIVVIALLFRENIMGWINELLDFGEGEIQDFKSNE